MLFDSHCHLNFSVFAENYREIIADCLKKEIGVINIGSQFDTSKRAAEIAAEFPNKEIYASVGLHPIHISGTEVDDEEIKFKGREEKFDEEKYQELIDNYKNKIIAVGEIGLDYWHIPINNQQLTVNKKENWKEKQKESFIAQLNFAVKNNLPVILHARGSKENSNDAYEDMLKIIQLQITNYKLRITGVLHCFGSSRKIAQQFLDLGFYLGFTGIITFKNKNVEELKEVVKMAPLDKILVETDAPYLSPEPFRGKKNTPQNVEFVARQVAELKNTTFEKVCEQTTKNIEKVFRI
ncbi:MAG: TatD family hydrolase [Patescibacteria group bacterium]|nr:TatD family hydrolase [Patescibacteria group bacterium]